MTYSQFGEERSARNASLALTQLLIEIAAKDPSKLALLSEDLRTAKPNPVARTPQEINPGRPDLARAAEIAPGWFVGLNIDNREKMTIIRTACDVYGISIPGDLNIVLPNA